MYFKKFATKYINFLSQLFGEGNLKLWDNLKAHSEVWDNFWQLETMEMMKNDFYFILKALAVLKIFQFLS